jgi:hypothetical protein
MAARKKVAAVLFAGIDPVLHRAPCRLGDLELHGPPGLALDDDGTIADTSAHTDILDLDGNKIAGTQFAVDRRGRLKRRRVTTSFSPRFREEIFASIWS